MVCVFASRKASLYNQTNYSTIEMPPVRQIAETRLSAAEEGFVVPCFCRRLTVVMPHVITDACTKDGNCLAVCPTDSIHPRKDEGDFESTTQLYIDPGTCIDCGVCTDECPQKAIYPEADCPDPKFVEANAAHFKS